MVRNAAKIDLIPFKDLNKWILILIVILFLLLLFGTPFLIYAQAPDTQPIIILPNKEVMPSSLPFDIRSLKTPGEPTSPPKSPAEKEWLEKEATITFDRIKMVDSHLANVNKRGEALDAEIQIHNDKHPGGCVYPYGNPSFCDGWKAEAKEQNDKMYRLKGEYQYLLTVRKDLVSHLKTIQARLKLK